MKKIFLLFFVILSFGIQAQNSPTLKAVDFQQLQKLITQNDDKVYVVNFWATWCKPCIEEIPGFMNVNAMYKDDPNFKMIMVSLDNKKLLETKVKKFVEKHSIYADVYLLDEKSHFTEWMPKIDPSWIGAIPATLIIKNGKTLFFRQFQITQFELEDSVRESLEN